MFIFDFELKNTVVASFSAFWISHFIVDSEPKSLLPLLSWIRFLCLPFVVAQHDKIHANKTASLLEWYDKHIQLVQTKKKRSKTVTSPWEKCRLPFSLKILAEINRKGFIADW